MLEVTAVLYVTAVCSYVTYIFWLTAAPTVQLRGRVSSEYDAARATINVAG